jgi:hypothetical protein
MAEPTEYELLKRDADQLRWQCSDYLKNSAQKQHDRWEELRRHIGYAGDVYILMRHNALEQRFDNAAPGWTSVILTVLVSFVPVSQITGIFLTAMTKPMQKWIPIILGQRRKLKKFQEQVPMLLERELDIGHIQRRQSELLSNIQRTENLIVRFAKTYEPELANILQDGAQELAKWGYREFSTPKIESGGREFSQGITEPPMVVVKKWFDDRSQHCKILK